MQSSINNIYKLDGTVPIAKAIPFGLQHIAKRSVPDFRL